MNSMCLLLHLLIAPYLMFTLELVLGRPVTTEAVIALYSMTSVYYSVHLYVMVNYRLSNVTIKSLMACYFMDAYIYVSVGP